MPDLYDLITGDTPLRRTSSNHGGEYSGPCPLCHRGTDRFKVWPKLGHWACLGASAGRAGCDVGGDAIDYLRLRDRLSFAEACAELGLERPQTTQKPHAPQILSTSHPAPLVPPNATWQLRASAWADACAARLWTASGARAREWLHARGLDDSTLRQAGIGYQGCDQYQARALWGLSPTQDHSGRPVQIWLPRGIVIPWRAGAVIWRVNVRRPVTPCQVAAGQPKYVGPAGYTPGLYNAGLLAPPRPVVLVEGELDALTVQQACGDKVAAVATGSTGGARRAAWVAQLALAPCVLVAFDVDPNGAGDQAAAWWLRVLPNAHRWRPLCHDVNAMQMAGFDVREWVEVGIEQ